MKILVLGNRGALINQDPAIGGAVWLDLADCLGVTILDLRLTMGGISPGKRAYDWLRRGRGYSKFSVVESPVLPGLAGYTNKSILKTFGKAPKSLRKVHILGKLVDNTGYRQK